MLFVDIEPVDVSIVARLTGDRTRICFLCHEDISTDAHIHDLLYGRLASRPTLSHIDSISRFERVRRVLRDFLTVEDAYICSLTSAHPYQPINVLTAPLAN